MPLRKYNTSSVLQNTKIQEPDVSPTPSCRITNHLYSINDMLPNIIENAVSCSASATGSANAAVNSANTSNLNSSSSSSTSSSYHEKLPNELRVRLYEIFSQIEKEFDQLYIENLRLKKQIENLEKHNSENCNLKATSTSMNTISSSTSTLVANNFQSPKIDEKLNSSVTVSKNSLPNSKTSSQISAAPKNRINNLSFPKFKPNAREFIMQSIKNTSAQIVNKTTNNLLLCKSQSVLSGHKDGIWDVNCVQIPNYLIKNSSLSQSQNFLLGTASADTTARLWFYNINQNSTHSPSNSMSPHINSNYQSNSLCFQEYSGHTGSVNSLRFHPKFYTNSTNLVLSSSGDGQAHLWQCVINQNLESLEINNELTYNKCYNYCNNNVNNSGNNEIYTQPSVIRSPIKRFEGHQDACIAAEWFPDGECIATASWDRTANVYNVETGKILCNLQHDDYLTNVNIHKIHKILLTSSKDTTFKIWDFRDPICSVQIYQGHSRSVNSAIFINEDKIATSSDDHTVKIWDLRIMRSPVCVINCNSGINRICTMNMSIDSNSNETFLCLPLDNRDIKIYNLQGERIIRLNRNNRVGHRRLVTSLASCNNLLFSASFDKCVNSWSFDYNPSKSSVINKSSNKENSEILNSENGIGLGKCIENPTILTQLSNLTSPNQPSILAPKTSNSATKSLINATKFIERVKI
ncbi:unnamed protein product [Brachionus calyciflorus]|uniref:WD repeat-containing protein 37 n=1 Tax=Brachionus calyciflorus TaxID=104777 RepID=A0A813RZQ4_9BILA|nr:unnamed protein product [Brachionus calyciflorus]